MRCLILSVVAIGIVLTAGAANAQDEQAQYSIPEKVLKALEWRIGTWEWAIEGAGIKGIWTYKWTSGKRHIIGEGHIYLQGNRQDFTEIITWDGFSEDGLTTYWAGLSMNQSEHSKVISSTVEEGEFKGAQRGARMSGHVRTVRQGPDKFTIVSTERTLGDKSLPDEKIVLTRINPTGHRKEVSKEQALARNKAQLRRYFDEIFNKMDLTDAHEFISPKFGVDPEDQTDTEAVIEGDSEYVAFFKGIFAMLEKKYDVNLEVREIVAEGNRAAALYKATGLWYPGPNGRTEENAVGVPVEVDGMGLYEFDENGLIVDGHPVENASPIVKAEMEYAQKRQSDLESRNKAQVKRYYDEVFNKRDLSNAHEFLSPSLTINGRKLEGGYTVFYQNIHSYLESKFDEVMISIDEIIAEGNTVAIRFRGTGTYYPGGRTGQDPVGVPFEGKGMGFYEFDEKGLMIRITFMEDDEQIKAADNEYAERQKEN